MCGKIVPYVLIGFTQASIIIIAARLLFHVPVNGELWVLAVAVLIFIVGNLSIGFAISSMASNQLQALQMSTFVFLPSLMLSGFMFPFRGMPEWAQAIGSAFPITYFIRIARGVMLKGNGWFESWPNIWPMLLLMLIIVAIVMKVYRRTLD